MLFEFNVIVDEKASQKALRVVGMQIDECHARDVQMPA